MDAPIHERAEPLNFHFGERERFCFEWQWASPDSSELFEVTNADCLLWIAGYPVWGNIDGQGELEAVEVPLMYFVEYFSANWDWLRLEERYPLDLSAEYPSEVWEEAEERWDELGEIPEGEDEKLVAFQDRHDLSQAFAGLDLRSVWVLRTGATVTADAGTNRRVKVRADEFFRHLENAATAIVERIDLVDADYGREIVGRWNERGFSSQKQASIYTGFEDEKIEPLWNYSENERTGDFRPDEQFAAARQLDEWTQPAEIEAIAKGIDAFESRSTDELDNLVESLIDPLDWRDSKAYAEGRCLAEEIRKYLVRTDEEFSHRSRVEPSDLLGDWNVEVREVEFDFEHVDALAVWGPNHGPGVLVNLGGKRAQSERGRRSSLAHEMCHLLVDRSRELPLAEVLGGKAPARAEKRANAFAAELLLPRQIAGERALKGFKDGRTVQRTVENLCNYYAVGREVAAWQIRRSDYWSKLQTIISRQWYQKLKNMVSNPSAY